MFFYQEKKSGKNLAWGNGGSSGDTANNAEKIVFSGPTPSGDLLVTVLAPSVPKGHFEFSFPSLHQLHLKFFQMGTVRMDDF